MSSSRRDPSANGPTSYGPCARTDAVLAVHLDGDLEPTPALDREQFGYGFVSDDSLHDHLRECTTCQLALQRSRRLDAALAATTGRAIADLVSASGRSQEQLHELLLHRAGELAETLAETSDPSKPSDHNHHGSQVDPVQVDPLLFDAVPARTADSGPTTISLATDLLTAIDTSTATTPAEHGATEHGAAENGTAENGTAENDTSTKATWIALVGLIAACVATWLCLLAPERSTKSRKATTASGTDAPDKTIAHAVTNQASGDLSDTATAEPVPPAGLAVADAAATPTQPVDSPTGNPPTGNSLIGDPPIGGPLQASSLAQHLHAARNRELPEQRTTQPHELASRIADRQLSASDRFAAAKLLLQATKPGSTATREAADALFQALAACGDCNQAEAALHGDLLDEVRGNGSMLVRLEHRLASLPARSEPAHAESSATSASFPSGSQHSLSPTSQCADIPRLGVAAIVVATRLNNERLDTALRRALRRNDAVADIVASALRCGARLHGATELLLHCWHDQVAIGRQGDTPQWAEFWFRGQADATFAQLNQVLATEYSAPERVRCLLAMGCAHDDATLEMLLESLTSPRRLEACAAACGLAALPHRVLKRLVHQARQSDASLLRAALARAGLTEAQAWTRQLALSKSQQQLLQHGPVTRFPEVVSWFRNGSLAADE